MSCKSAIVLPAIVLVTGFLVPVARADSADRQVSSFVSNAGTAIYLTAAVAMPFINKEPDALSQAARTAESGVTSLLITEGLSSFIHEKRPDGSDYHSFPSEHATAAFTAATIESAYHPKQSVWWFGGATLIAASRVDLRRHFIQDVGAGALIGYGVARLELSFHHGFVLHPWIQPVGGAGLQVSKSW